MDTPITASRNRWLIRLRSCRACGRKTQAVSYVSDDFYKSLKKEGGEYDRYKAQVEQAANQETVWPFDAIGPYASSNSGIEV